MCNLSSSKDCRTSEKYPGWQYMSISLTSYTRMVYICKFVFITNLRYENIFWMSGVSFVSWKAEEKFNYLPDNVFNIIIEFIDIQACLVQNPGSHPNQGQQIVINLPWPNQALPKHYLNPKFEKHHPCLDESYLCLL